MPPKITTHSRIPSEPRQTRLSSRAVRPLTHRRASPPPRQKRQSTLTQFDRIRNGDTVIPSSDSDDDGDFSDYEASKPRKKPRLGSKKKGKGVDRRQSTLTQKWDWKAMGETLDSEESDEDLTIVDREGDVSPPNARGHTQTQGALLLSTAMHSDTDSDASTHQSKHLGFRNSSDVEKTSTRPSTAGSTIPKTPSRPRRAVIPSSQTPSSLKLSRHSSKLNEQNEPSPLKERSSNLSSFKRTRSSQSLKKNASNDSTSPSRQLENDLLEAQPWSATLTITPKKALKTTKSALQRTTTIQESDNSDLDMDLAPILSSQRKRQEAQPEHATQAAEPKARSLQRVGTIQDSEENASDLLEPPEGQRQVTAESDDVLFDRGLDTGAVVNDRGKCGAEPGSANFNFIEVDSSPKRASQSTPPDLEDFETAMDTESYRTALSSVAKAQPTDVNADDSIDSVNLEVAVGVHDFAADQMVKSQAYAHEEDEDNMYPETYPQTYDPVYAALERDAARYGRETQFESDVEDADDEGSVVAETDAGSMHDHVLDEVEVVPSSQPVEDKVQCYQELTAIESVDQERTTANNTSQDPNANQYDSGHEDTAPRPSQISTVDGDTQLPKAVFFNSSTQKSMPMWPETLTSSPFPMPPTFTSMSQRRRGETQSSGLLDFSLPPPPPLFSSSSKGEGG